MLKEYKTGQIRNVAIIGHGSTGKSTLFESMLFVGGSIEKMGSHESGTLTSDFDEDEKKRKISIRSSMGFVEFEDVKINIIDTPGISDFTGEAMAALQASECAILVVDSVDGVQIETEKWWRYLKSNNIPRIIFVNKMDRERASYEKVTASLKDNLTKDIAVLCFPVGEAETFSGVVDITHMKLMTPIGDGRRVNIQPLPEEHRKHAEDEWQQLMELAAEGDDELIEKFLDGGELNEGEIERGIRERVDDAKLTAVICGSALKVTGITNLLKVIKDFAPAPVIGKKYRAVKKNDKSPAEITCDPDAAPSAVVWKTYIDQYAGRFNYIKAISGVFTPEMEVLNPSREQKERIGKLYSLCGNRQVELPALCAGDLGVVVKLEKTCTGNTLCAPSCEAVFDFMKLPSPVYSYAVEPQNKGDVDKIGLFFTKAAEENPTIKYEFNAETHESVLSGMGEMQLSILLQNLKDKMKIDVNTREPGVAYRETINIEAESNYRHKKQSGGHGQFGEVFIRLKPLPRGEGFKFTESLFGGAIPRQYVPGVEKGIVEAMHEGVLGKFPVVDVAVDLYDGKYHDVDSSEMAFKIAARQAFKEGMEKAKPQLLEPVMNVSIYVDKQFMGDILSDITSRRGKVIGMDSEESEGSVSVVKATVPLSEMQRYAIDLRSMTQGKATFEMSFSHYDPISGKDAENVLSTRKKFLDELSAEK